MTTHQSARSVAPLGSAHPAPPPPSGRLQPGTKVQVGQYVVQIEKFLSEGGFAHVYVASLVSPSNVEGFPASQNRFVLKRMAVPDKAGLVEVRKEVDVMKQLRPHKHIVYFIEASASSIPGNSGYEIFILMEWCPGGGIIDLLNSRLQNRLTESEILKIFSDTVKAVAHMHSQDPILIHRDLKVENILVASPNLYKLCDFGSTTSPLPRPPQTSAEIMSLEADLNKHTTLQYRAPEMVDVWSRKGVTEKADIWALGVFLYKLCYYTTPFEAHGPLAIVNVQYQIPSYPAYSNSIKYLIGTMLQEIAQSRPDIWEVHEHVCKLGGITPHLLRPKRKSHTSNGSNPSFKPIQPKPTSNATSENRLDSIFTTTFASSAPQTHQKTETVVPMRRGRPTTKTKPTAGITTTSHDDAFFGSANSAVFAPSNVIGKIISPPEESDLFAREAAAGFGDAFLSPSPPFTSFKPTVQNTQGSVEPHLPVTCPQPSFKPLAPKPQIHRDSKTAALSAFEDLVPSRKQTPPKTLNEIRNNLPNVNSAITGPAPGTYKLSSHDRPFIVSNTKLPETRQNVSMGVGKLSQKTGPQSLPSRVQQNTVYRKISITQRTGPAISSGLPAVIPQAKPSISDWLEKDQAKLVSRSTQTSPSLLKSLVSELTQGAQLNIFDNNKLANPSIDLLNEDNFLHVEPSQTTRANHRIVDGKPRLQGTYIHDRRELSAQSRIISNPSKSLPTLGIPPVERKSSQDFPQTDRETSISSDSDEEPEDPKGLKGYRAQAQSTLPINSKTLFKPNGETTPLEVSRHAPAVQLPLAEDLANDVGLSDTHEPLPSQPSRATSVTELSSSEATTEEDEGVKWKRRAAIAKFAPAAKVGDSKAGSNQLSRDPFSSRARSRSVSPEPSALSTTMASEHIKRQVAPPLRAPKPQSLKSAAAINNLVSRYENLSANTSDPPSSIKSPSTTVGIKKRQSIFKPIPSVSNSINEKVNNSVIENTNASLSKSSVHIPKTFLGPGVMSSTRVGDPAVASIREDEDAEERFTSVNDMKSKWESGAVQASQHPKDRRLPRTDYGQT